MPHNANSQNKNNIRKSCCRFRLYSRLPNECKAWLACGYWALYKSTITIIIIAIIIFIPVMSYLSAWVLFCWAQRATKQHMQLAVCLPVQYMVTITVAIIIIIIIIIIIPMMSYLSAPVLFCWVECAARPWYHQTAHAVCRPSPCPVHGHSPAAQLAPVHTDQHIGVKRTHRLTC